MNIQTKIIRGSELSAKDIYSILQLRNAVFIVELERPLQDIDGEDLSPSVAQLLTMTEDGRVVGHLRMHFHGKSVHVRRVVVAKDFRGKALGRSMMERAIQYCKNGGIEKVTIAARAHLQKFYGSLNFVPVGELYFHKETAVWHRDMELIF